MSSTPNLEYLLSRILKTGATDIDIYQGRAQDYIDPDTNPIFTIKEGQNAADELEDFAKFWKGNFIALLRKKSGTERKRAERVAFSHFLGTNYDTGAPVAAQLAAETEAQMRARIMAELHKNEVQNNLLFEISELKKQVSINGQMDNRLGNILTVVGDKLGWFKGLNFAQAEQINNSLNGLKMTEQKGQFNIDNLTETQEEELAIVIEIIFSYLGLDAMKKVANALQSDPTLVTKLNLFI